MAEYQRRSQVTGKTMLFAAVAGIIIGVPLLALMALTLFATVTLFLISAPLLIIFSPLLLGAVFVFVAALVGFGLAVVMAMAGIAAFAWVLRSVRGSGFATGRLIAAGERVKDAGNDWANYLKQPENGAAI